MNSTEICRYLPWDSEFFGRKIARLTAPSPPPDVMQNALSWCQNEAVECLYWLADADSGTIRLAEANGFGLMDARLVLNCHLAPNLARVFEKSGAPIHLRAASAEDIDSLRAIARISHRDTRFYADPHFPDALCDALYEKWLERSFEGYADVVFLAEWNGQIAGYVSCVRNACAANKNGASSGQIGLLAVAPQAQGHGIGGALVNRALSWFAQNSVEHIEVATQARNSAAQRVYQKCGFLTGSLHLWYHRWFSSKDLLR